MHLSVGATAFLCDSAAHTSPSFILCKVQQRLLHSARFQLQTAADDICDLTVVLNACIAQMVSVRLIYSSAALTAEIHTQLARYVVSCLQLYALHV